MGERWSDGGRPLTCISPSPGDSWGHPKAAQDPAGRRGGGQPPPAGRGSSSPNLCPSALSHPHAGRFGALLTRTVFILQELREPRGSPGAGAGPHDACGRAQTPGAPVAGMLVAAAGTRSSRWGDQGWVSQDPFDLGQPQPIGKSRGWERSGAGGSGGCQPQPPPANPSVLALDSLRCWRWR